MTGKFWRQIKALPQSKAPTAWIWLARFVAVFTIATLPLACTAFTGARYVAAAGVNAAARVAKWDVKVECLEVFPKVKDISSLPQNGTPGDHPLVLFFEGLKKNTDPTTGTKVEGPASFLMTLTNDSEVTARFTPTWDTDAGTPDIGFYKTYTPGAPGTYSDPIATTGANAGIELAPDEKLDVYVVIKNSTFTYLKLGAICVQVD
ncbi:MAG: hypothetical protein FWC27_12140 [Firmicutes bacterium]|nr:hypothetical protein [Bacillota bacterium]